MSNRPAVSLVEVLVATVLLAVGVAGCVAALQAATRLRVDAAAREAATATVERRLAWFETHPCPAADSLIVVGPPDAERWVLARDSTSAVLDGRAERALGARSVRIALRARRPCP